MSINSSQKLPRLALAPHFTEKAAGLLMDFANTHPEDLYRFVQKWSEQVYWGWSDYVQDIVETQQTVRSIWEGKFSGSESSIIDIGLGLAHPRQNFEPGYFDTSMSLFHVNWEDGFIWASPRDLNDYVWLSLLQYSKRLAICANKEGGCPTPYFIKAKPNQKFCSDACALPAQREFKRQWWSEHGATWRQERLTRKSRKRSRLEKGK